jgi:[ribosomal protein S18]-alanine N-acetyltransferase
MWPNLILPWFKLIKLETRYRTGVMGDSARLAQIHAEGFAYPWDRLEFERLMSQGALVDLLVSQGFFGEIATGFAISRVVAGEAELLTIALDREVRGKHLSAPLLETHAARLRRAGAQCLFLEVADDNTPALNLYRGMGFAEIGRRKGYYPGPAQGAPRRDALTMRLDLSHLDPTPRVM